MLQVNSMNSNNQMNQTIQDDQLVILTFPSGINLQQLINNNATADSEDIGIVFVVYAQSALFPVQDPVVMMDNTVVETVVGTSVVSLTIAGLLPGTNLTEPLVITFTINQEVFVLFVSLLLLILFAVFLECH